MLKTTIGTFPNIILKSGSYSNLLRPGRGNRAHNTTSLEKYPISKTEHQIWCLDQAINDYGVLVDTQMVKHAIKCASSHQKKLEEEAIQLTGLDNPKSVTQIKRWLKAAEGLEVESLNKAAIPGLLKEAESDTVKRVLELRQELSKTSIKKYEAMERSKCKDNRIRGLFQFYGANRSGRWAGRLVQVQNLPQNHLEDLDLARQLLRSGEYETLEMLFECARHLIPAAKNCSYCR